jgi:hypothetical protein
VSFRILDAADPADRRTWVETWKAWPQREVAAHPAYAELFSASTDRTLCAALVQDGGGVLFPLCLRPLAQLAWAAADETRADVTTPYGYGGPFAWGDTGGADLEFWPSLARWAIDADVVSLFARLSLFEEQLLAFDPGADLQSPMQNVVRSLSVDADATWRDYAHKVRKNVKRARSNGLAVEVDPNGESLDAFLDIYLHTMDRREAAQSFLFDRAFFERIIRELAGFFCFFHVRYRGNIVSSELVLVSTDYAYSFLGGTRADAFDKRPNDLLKHEVIGWARANGKRALVLGGGYGADDGIFKYKKSFAPNGVVPFHVARRIYDQESYDELVVKRRAHEARYGRQWEPPKGFFPAYRG